jgi:enoyl-CoA hydratase/carnithine racemase
MALFGEVFTAEQALALGFVDQVVASGEGMAAAEQVAERVLSKGARASELTKMLINAAEGEERERVLESLAGAIAAGSTELAEGLAAFTEKRKPRFGGKD